LFTQGLSKTEATLTSLIP